MVCMDALRKRHVSGLGWISDRDGVPVAVSTRSGPVRLAAEVVGTKEAAAIIGVRPSNFVRDWASRVDFPRPISSLSSGRVWSRADVVAYQASLVPPSRDRLLAIARRAVWWQDPDTALGRPVTLAAHVLAKGSLEDVRDLERAYGRDVLRKAVADAAAGIFDARSWTFWLLALDMDRSLPLPSRRAR